MRSLFLKIFVWFWATVIVTGIALILTFILEVFLRDGMQR